MKTARITQTHLYCTHARTHAHTHIHKHTHTHTHTYTLIRTHKSLQKSMLQILITDGKVKIHASGTSYLLAYK